MYSIEFSQTAEKQLYKLERQAQLRIISVLERIRIRPFNFVKRIIGSPYYRLRIGDYRVIMDIKQAKLVIFVIELGHRKSIYK